VGGGLWVQMTKLRLPKIRAQGIDFRSSSIVLRLQTQLSRWRVSYVASKLGCKMTCRLEFSQAFLLQMIRQDMVLTHRLGEFPAQSVFQPRMQVAQ
jgi:hypothetical protein